MLLLTAGGLGFMARVPGTWGSLPPVVLAVAMLLLATPAWFLNGVLIALAVIFSLACLAFGAWGEERFGRKDDRRIVADEVAGQSVALMFLPWQPASAWALNLAIAFLALAAFRIFDIWKPPPARGLQRLPAGLGVLVDDLIAGLYAWLLMQAFVRVFFPFA